MIWLFLSLIAQLIILLWLNLLRFISVRDLKLICWLVRLFLDSFYLILLFLYQFNKLLFTRIQRWLNYLGRWHDTFIRVYTCKLRRQFTLKCLFDLDQEHLILQIRNMLVLVPIGKGLLRQFLFQRV